MSIKGGSEIILNNLLECLKNKLNKLLLQKFKLCLYLACASRETHVC